MNKKNVVLGLIVGILTLIVVLSYFRLNTRKSSDLMPIPVFNAGGSPKPGSQNPITNPASKLSLLNIIPGEDISTQFSPTQQIELVFSDIVDPEKLHIKITPDIKISIEAKIADTKSLLLYPASSWVDGITTLTILEDTQSLNGSFLNKKIIYKINTGLPDYSNFIE